MGYLASVAGIRYIDGALSAVARLAATASRVFLVTNQSGIARGLIEPATLERIHMRMMDDVRDAGGRVDGVYCCPHDPMDNCVCRKPQPGLLLQASREWGIDLSRSVMVGDRESDVEAGRAAGTRTVRIGGRARSKADAVFPSLLAAAAWIEAALAYG